MQLSHITFFCKTEKYRGFYGTAILFNGSTNYNDILCMLKFAPYYVYLCPHPVLINKVLPVVCPLQKAITALTIVSVMGADRHTGFFA